MWLLIGEFLWGFFIEVVTIGLTMVATSFIKQPHFRANTYIPSYRY
jgi:hypothetical protein